MTIEQFNEKYRISVQVSALQEATLAAPDEEGTPSMSYGSIDTIIDTVDIGVYDKETQEEEFLYDGNNETSFLEELYERFNIQH